nr:MAG TPA: hypothetical protein [Crassvirales sp.]
MLLSLLLVNYLIVLVLSSLIIELISFLLSLLLSILYYLLPIVVVSSPKSIFDILSPISLVNSYYCI